MKTSACILLLSMAIAVQVIETEGWTKISSLTKLTNYKKKADANNLSVGTVCTLKFKDCGSVEGTLFTANYVNGTCHNGVALLKKGTTAYIDFNFQASHTEPTLTSKVAGKIGPLPWVNFPLDNPDACKDSHIACPVPANKKFDFIPHIKVLSSYPSVNVIVRWELRDAKGKDVYCAELLASIVS